MPNEKLLKLYAALTTPNASLGGKSLYTPESLGGSVDAFAKKLEDKAKLEKLYTTLTTPSDAIGGKSFYTPEALGGSIDLFSEKIGIQKKSPIGSESSNGSAPSQDNKDIFLPYPIPGQNIQSNPFKPVSIKPKQVDTTKKVELKRNESDFEQAINTIPQTITKQLASMPRYFYDFGVFAGKQFLGTGAKPFVDTPSYDEVRSITRDNAPGAINSLDFLDSLSKKAQLEGDRLNQKISTNKVGYIDLIKEKEYSTLLSKTVNDLIISAPAMAAISVNPTVAATMFASAKNLDLVDNQSVPDDLKPFNAFITGLAEVVLEGKIGGTAVLKNTIEEAFKKGVGEEVLEKTIREMAADWAKKMYPAGKEIALAGVEEASTDIIQQLTSYFTGETDSINLQQSLDAFAGGVSGAGALKVLGKAVGASAKKVKDLTAKRASINEQIDNPNISTKTKQDLAEEVININSEISKEMDNSKVNEDSLSPKNKQEVQDLSSQIKSADDIIDNPEVSDDIKKSMEAKKDELNGLIEDIITLNKKELSDKDSGKTKSPISEMDGESITMNIGGKNITGRVYVDEGGKATLESNNIIYEIPENANYVEYSSPISIVDDSIEYNGQKFDDVRVEKFNGTERAILIDSGKNGNKGKVRTITKPEIVEEIKYTLALKDLDNMSDEDAQQIINEYETRTQEETPATSEEVSNGEVRPAKEDEALNQAIAEIDLIEQIALEEIAQSENASKLVERKAGAKNNVYVVSKNNDGSYSATLNGRNVKRPDVLKELGDSFENQNAVDSKTLIAKLQEQTNALKLEVEQKLFGKKEEVDPKAETESTTEKIDEQKDSQQNDKPKRKRIEKKRDEAKVSEADRGDSNSVDKKEAVASDGKKLFSEPSEDVIRVSSEYKQENGIDNDSGERIYDINIEEAKRRADAFEEMKHDPNNPEVKKSYNAMADETANQFDFLVQNGYSVEVFEGTGEPYKNSQEMLKDLIDNKHLFMLSTEKDFGQNPITDKQRDENPLLKDSGKKDINGKALLINDLFRFVHDVFGHGERGNSFGAKGEENAWDVHARMYSPLARKAMTTETRGQNSWVNFGEHMRNEDGSIKKQGDEGYLSPTQRPFAEQKIGLMPEFAYKLYFTENNTSIKTSEKPVEKSPVQKEIDKIKDDIDYSERRIEDKQEDIENIKSDLREKIQELKDKKKKLREKRMTAEEREEEYDGIDSEIEDAKDDADVEIDYNKTEITELKKDITASKKQLAKLEEKLKTSEVEKPTEDTKPEVRSSLTENEQKYKESPDALSKDQLKDVLASKRDRLKKAYASLEKGELTKDEIEAKKKAISILERTEEELIKRIDSGVKSKVATKEDALQEEKSKLKEELRSLSKKSKDNASKLGFSALETEEQIRERVNNDKEYLSKLVRYAVVSIELGLVKSMNQLRNALKKDIGLDFTKALNKELGLIYNTAKSEAKIAEKKTIKKTIKEATEVKTDKKVVVSFADFMDSIYKSENKGLKTKQQLMSAAFAYLKKADISNLATSKIMDLVARGIELNSFDKFNKSFVDYVSYYTAQADRLAKVREAEVAAKKLARKANADKFGQITPQISRLAGLNVDLLSSESIDLFMDVVARVSRPKLADVKDFYKDLQALIEEERDAIENGIENNLFTDKELIDMIDKLHLLNQEFASAELESAAADAVSKKQASQLNKLLKTLSIKRSIIMSYIDSAAGKINSIEDYIKLNNSIKQYNAILNSLSNIGALSDIETSELSIKMSNRNLTLIEEALKEKMDEFKTALAKNTQKLLGFARNQFNTGGLRARLFSTLPAFTQKLYTPILLGVLDEKAVPILSKLDISDLSMYNKAVEQLLNGYISPKLRELNEIINAAYVQEDMGKHVESYIEDEAKADSSWNKFTKNFFKSIEDFNTPTEVADFLKGKNWQSVASSLNESGLAKIYEKYVYPVLSRSFTSYLFARKNAISKASLLGDKVSDINKVILGVFATQLDLMRYKDWNGEVLIDELISRYDGKKLTGVNKKKVEELKKARKLIKGDLSTPEGIKKTMDDFFATDKNAKALYDEIRNSIDQKLFPMTKMNIEREGGYVEFDDNYFPVQRMGGIEYNSQSFKDLFNPTANSKNISTRSDATFKRVADPIVMREFNILKAFDSLADDVTKNFYLRPVVVPLERSINNLASKYADEKSDTHNPDIAVFLQGIKEYVHASLAIELGRKEYDSLTAGIQKVTAYFRNLYLANLYSRAKDFLANVALVTTSGNPLESVKYLAEQEANLDLEDFQSLAELTSSPIVFNKSISDLEEQYNVGTKSSKRRMDAMASIADVPIKRKFWKMLILKGFKEATGKDFDYKAFKADPIAYYSQNKNIIDEVARKADYEVDKKFSSQLPIGQSIVYSILPFIKQGKFQRKSPAASITKFMTTYVAWNSDVILNATRRLVRSGDIKGFVKDVTPIIASNITFVASGYYIQAAAAVSAYSAKSLFSSMFGLGDDDEDKKTIAEYADEQFDWANSNFIDGDGANVDEIKNNMVDFFSTILTSKYAFGAKAALNTVASLGASAQLVSAETKADKADVAENWNAINDYYRSAFKSNIVFIGDDAKKSRLPNMASDFMGLIPVIGSYNNVLSSLLKEKDESSIASLAKGINERDVEKALVGLGQAGALIFTGLGQSWAPTAYALATSEAKLEGRKAAQKRQKEREKGKSSKGGSGFSGSDFGSGFGPPQGF